MTWAVGYGMVCRPRSVISPVISISVNDYPVGGSYSIACGNLTGQLAGAMAKIGIVSDDQFDKEVSNTVIMPDVKATVVETPHRGRQVGDVNVPDGIRKIIGEESIINGRAAALELAADFGVSASSVSAYAKSATSTASYNNPQSSLSNYLASRKSRLNKKALRVLHHSLDSITPDKLNELSATKLASVAKDMSVISKNMEPKQDVAGGESRPQFVVYAPQVRDERTYETIIVNDGF